ncbi:MAG: hypothetical protein V8T85_11805 [Blautia faecicola]
MEQSRAWVQALRENIGKVLVGKEETIDLVLTTLAAGGHVLLEDVPGTGKQCWQNRYPNLWMRILDVFSLHRIFCRRTSPD